MKKLALSLALSMSLLSTAAVAGEQRPTYLAFKAPASATAGIPQVSPAAPTVKKRNGAIGGIPLFVPLVAGMSILGFVAAVSTGSNSSPG